jgi:hypothetical protein
MWQLGVAIVESMEVVPSSTRVVMAALPVKNCDVIGLCLP